LVSLEQTGKTTIAFYISIIQKAGFKVGLISTVKFVDDVEYKATYDT
jgi:uncharacterized protein YmfQ (DUF2313 family)